MKKKSVLIVLLLCFFLVSIFSFAGCAPQTAAPSGVQRLNMGSGWVTGVYYPLAGAMSRIAHNFIDNISLTVESSGASVVNVKMIGSGDLDLAIVQNDVAYYAYEGEGREDFIASPITNMRGMFVLYPEPVQLVAATKAGINSPADLAGKRVALGPLGSGAEVNALQVLEAAGLSEADLASVERLEAGEAADYLRDGRVDAAFYTVGIGASVISELAVISDIHLVNIEGAIASALIEEYPFFASVPIPADTYSGVAGATTIAVLSMVVCRDDLSADLAYDFVKGIFDNIETIHNAHDTGKMVTLDTALDGMSIPLHPGAEKFFQEAGML